MVDASIIFSQQLIITVSSLAGMGFGWWMKPQWDKWMAPMYTTYIGLSANKLLAQKKVTNRAVRKKEGLPEVLQKVPVDRDTIHSDDNGGRFVLYNASTNGKLEAKSRLASLYDNIDAADDQASQNIERVHKSHGEIPWVLLILGGILLVAFIISITLGGAFWFASTRTGG